MSPRASAWVAGACALLLVHAGCATAPKMRTDDATDCRAAADIECRSTASRSAEIGDVREAFGSGLALTTYLVLRGAGEGAWWGIVTGSRAGDRAWIAAAAGAGVGAHERYRAAYDACLASR